LPRISFGGLLESGGLHDVVTAEVTHFRQLGLAKRRISNLRERWGKKIESKFSSRWREPEYDPRAVMACSLPHYSSKCSAYDWPTTSALPTISTLSVL